MCAFDWVKGKPLTRGLPPPRQAAVAAAATAEAEETDSEDEPVSGVCVGVGGVVLCRCVCVCDLSILLQWRRSQRPRTSSALLFPPPLLYPPHIRTPLLGIISNGDGRGGQGTTPRYPPHGIPPGISG